ncbi:hypothetical protein MMC18_005480 [Xylographa bjoerkii]|nr:hypothetical protein [Xylographa bjoerkii]
MAISASGEDGARPSNMEAQKTGPVKKCGCSPVLRERKGSRLRGANLRGHHGGGRQHGDGDKDGNGPVTKKYGAVGQVLIQGCDRLPQVEIRRLCGRPLQNEVVDNRGAEQDRVEICDVVGDPLEPNDPVKVEVDAGVNRVGQVPSTVKDANG